MILSKRPDMFLPLKWPSYFSKAKGCNIWDLSGKKFIDMSMMGIGTNILGYGNKSVDFNLDSFKKKCLIEGLDDIALSLEKISNIENYEKQLKKNKPWI